VSLVVDWARELIAIPSVSGQEASIADYVADHLEGAAGVAIERHAGCVVARCRSGSGPRVLVVGHLDTVPGEVALLEDEAYLGGLGACDMKGGLAVMLGLAHARMSANLTLVFYPNEEVAFAANGLHGLGAVVARHDLGVVLEPTGNFVELGCQGTLRARVELRGRQAHTSRPWMGVNAIARLGEVLDLVATCERRRPVLGGVEYRESLEPVRVEGFVAYNVVPDRARLWVNHRFAPDRSPEEASHWLARALEPALSPEDSLMVEEATAGAPPATDGFSELLARARGVRAKLGWTDVAYLASLGVPAVNFGPGDPLLAHSGREVVAKADLEDALEALQGWVASL
jgi:succinyl-diaminopimelate desuccinylase